MCSTNLFYLKYLKLFFFLFSFGTHKAANKKLTKVQTRQRKMANVLWKTEVSPAMGCHPHYRQDLKKGPSKQEHKVSNFLGLAGARKSCRVKPSYSEWLAKSGGSLALCKPSPPTYCKAERVCLAVFSPAGGRVGCLGGGGVRIPQSPRT